MLHPAAYKQTAAPGSLAPPSISAEGALLSTDPAALAVVPAAADLQAGRRVQPQPGRALLREVEQRVEGTGDFVERPAADPPQIPVVFDEPQNRRLIRGRVIDEVRLRVRRDDEERQPRPVAAAALRTGRIAGAALARIADRVRRRRGLAENPARDCI